MRQLSKGIYNNNCLPDTSFHLNILHFFNICSMILMKTIVWDKAHVGHAFHLYKCTRCNQISYEKSPLRSRDLKTFSCIDYSIVSTLLKINKAICATIKIHCMVLKQIDAIKTILLFEPFLVFLFSETFNYTLHRYFSKSGYPFIGREILQG